MIISCVSLSFILFLQTTVPHSCSSLVLFLQTLPLAFCCLYVFFCFIVCFSSTTFALVPLIIGRQLVELCVVKPTIGHQSILIEVQYIRTLPIAKAYDGMRQRNLVSFYRAMLCIRGIAMALCLSVLLSVCLSVTSRSSTKTAKRRITQTTPHDSPGILVL